MSVTLETTHFERSLFSFVATSNAVQLFNNIDIKASKREKIEKYELLFFVYFMINEKKRNNETKKN